MDRNEWERIIEDLRGEDVDLAVEAMETLDQKSDLSDVPALYNLLEDPSFFIREAAAFPLARLEEVKALPRLLDALTKGKEDGHDNDMLAFVISELLEEHPEEALPVILELMHDQEVTDRKNAAWAIGFLHKVTSPQPLLDLLSHETDLRVQSAAIGSLASFKNDEKVFQTLLARLHSESGQTRIDAAVSLGYYGDRRAKNPLRNALLKCSPKEREFISYALKTLGEK